MRISVYIIFLLSVILWGLTSGIHWGSSFILTTMLVASFCGVIWCDFRRDRLLFGRDMSWLAPYRGIGLIGVGLTLSIGLTILSLVPLPDGILEVISPEHAKIYSEAARLLGEEAEWGYLTASLGRTHYALWHLCGFLAIYFIGLRLGESHRFVRWFTRTVVTVGVIWGIWIVVGRIGIDISLGGGGTDAFMRFGLGINENHVSSVFVLLSLCSLGGILTFRHKDVWTRRGIWMSFYALFGICLILLQSRGALFSWLCAHVVMAALLWRRSRGGQKLATAAVLISICFIIGFATVALAPTMGAIKSEIEETSLSFDTPEAYHVGLQSKTQIYGDVARMASDWPMGIGRSAFGDVYPAYQSFGFTKRLRHVENEYFEWVVEYGVFFGILLIVLWAGAFVRWVMAYLRAPKEQELVVGLLCGLFGVALHNAFDFGMRYWTVGFIFFASAGVVEGRMNRWRCGKLSRLGEETSLSQSSQTLEQIPRELELINSRKKNSSSKVLSWLTLHREVVILTGICVVMGGGMIVCLSRIPEAVEGQSGLYLTRTAEALSGVRGRSSNRDLRGVESEQGMEFAQAAVDGMWPFSEEESLRIDRSLRIAVCSDGVRTLVGRAIVRRSAYVDESFRALQWGLARRWFESAIERAPREHIPRLALGKVCEGLGDDACAARQYLTAAQENPKVASVAMGEYVHLPESVQIMPDTWPAQKAFISALLTVGKYDCAESHIERVSDKAKRMQLAFDLYMRLGQSDIVEGMLSQLPESCFDEFDVYRLRADLYIRRKQYLEMIGYLERGRERFDDNPTYWRYYLHCVVWYGMILGQDAYREKVDALLLRVYRYRKSSSAWEMAYDLSQAKYALELGNGAQARRWARKALEKNPRHREAKRILDKAESKQE